MEEEVLSWKHVCKFCRKRFQCGRSLGGHMRSHMVNHVSTLTDGTLITRKKLPFLMKSEDEDDDEDSSNNINNGSCSGTSGVEEEKEQEEVAMCLMLLSRDDDVLSNSPSDDDESSASNKKGTVHVVMKSEIETETTTTTTDVLGDGVLDSEVICKFECETCSKTFHSYQALGGHRASHKRIKGCSSFKTHDHGGSKLIMITSINSEKKKSSSSDRIHECLICFKGFPSGQALGGHKRSHLLETSPRTRVPAEEEAAADAKIPVPGMEDFLVDLNLPAKVDEERNSTIVNNQWWTGSKHK